MCKTSNIDLLQERLGFPRFLVFPCTFSKQPIPFYRVACWDFNWDCIGIFFNWERFGILTVLSVPMNLAYLFIYAFFIFSQQSFVGLSVKLLHIFQ